MAVPVHQIRREVYEDDKVAYRGSQNLGLVIQRCFPWISIGGFIQNTHEGHIEPVLLQVKPKLATRTNRKHQQARPVMSRK